MVGKPIVLGLPLDVLFEIFWYLHPLDLVHLTRVSKQFRLFLLSCRKAKSIWTGALKRVDRLPQCPSYLSEPAYANLLFWPFCHRCHSSCDVIQWELRIRCCDGCTTEMLISREMLPLFIDHLNCLDVEQLVPMSVMCSAGPCVRHRDNTCRKPLTVASHADVNKLNRQYKFVKDSPLLNDLIIHREKVTQEIYQHAALCRIWEAEVADRRRKELVDQRKRDVIEKLKSLGLGDELESLRSDASVLKEFDNLVVRQDQELTDSSCQVSLLRLQNFLEIRRARRLTVLLQDRFKNLAVVASDMTKTFKNDKTNTLKVFPQAIDICLLSEVRCMIDVPEVMSTEAFVDALTLRLPHLFLAWNRQVTEQLADLVRAQLCGIDNDVDPLKLAALVFRCSNCRLYVTYPSALAHPCLRAKTFDKPWVQPPMETTALGRTMSLVEVYEKAAIEAFETYPWNCTVLEAGGYTKRIRNLFQVLGRDPNSTTVDDLESCPIRVTCKSCSGSRNRMILTYRTALIHLVRNHSDSKDDAVWGVVV
ncbi:uncharacterized protein EDB93DRAFT_927123 [Suillus bovinus]|uniref:uncharacterized protein n=1 Tax=Suillus bovinus TaxID=48563 RepID=UPI001B8698A7|nr:uncharacterized protein EDB93DRAFT_927123 [Suillus bovinus]KAG2156687.1 hypothetical protein EDB93DRAFT_927123 [Suillus bovinus]